MATNVSDNRPRVSLCCEPDLYLRDSECFADESHPAEKIILPEIYYSNLSISSMSPEEFAPQYGGINCFPRDLMYRWRSNLSDNAMIYLLENGTLFVNHSIRGGNSFNIDNYCLATRMTDDGPESVVAACLQPQFMTHLRIMIVNLILPILSMPFLVAIIIIHAILPEMRNVQGHIFRSYLAALLIMFITTAQFTAQSRCLPVMSKSLLSVPHNYLVKILLKLTQNVFSLKTATFHTSHSL